MQFYLVGGAVRDKLLGLPVTERDWVVVGATPKIMLSNGFKQVGKDFPVFLHPVSGEEYALARTEKKQGHGYSGFVFCANDITLEEDLQRRDLTINAIADDHGTLIDPYGGQQDLKCKILRHVSSSFIEDPLRVLRLARFAAKFAPLGFTIATETKQLLQQMVANGELSYLTKERVWQELAKSLDTHNPEVFFTTLNTVGGLEVLFPEVAELFTVNIIDNTTLGNRAMQSLNHISALTNDKTIKFAVLTQAFAELEPPSDLNITKTAYALEKLESFCKKILAPKDYVSLSRLVIKHRQHINQVLELSPKEKLDLLISIDAFRKTNRLTEMLLVNEAIAVTANQKNPDVSAAWRTCLAQISDVDIPSLMAKGLQGGELGMAIYQARLSKIS